MKRASSSFRFQPILKLGVPVLAILAVGIAANCGSEPSPGGSATTSSQGTTSSSNATASTTTSSATGSTTSSSSTSTSSTSGPVCTPRDIPEGIPEGWEEYTDWSCACRFYVPASKDALPAPIVWEPCPESPGGIDCRQMRVDWPHAYGGAIAFKNFLDWKPGSSPVLAFRRVADGAPHPYLLDMVAEVDGAVRNAVTDQPHRDASGAGTCLGGAAVSRARP